MSMAKAGRPQRPPLGRDYILDRALRIIDTVGLDGFTFRRLAKEIGADPMAAYYYFSNKAALFDGIVETVYREIRLKPVVSTRDPVSRVINVARQMRAAFLRHPRALPLLGTRPVATRAMVPLIDSFIAVLEEAGIAKARAVDAVNCIATFVIGHALAQAGEPVGGTDPAGTAAFLDEAKRYPRFARAIETASIFDPDRQFDYGIKAFVRGLLLH